MKIIKWAVLIIVILIVFTLFLFPYEVYFKSLTGSLEKEKNIKITWDKASFSFWKTEFKDITFECPGNFRLFYEKLTIKPSFAGLKVSALSDGEKNNAAVGLNKIDFNLKNLKLPESLKLLNGGNLDLKGYYYINKKNSIGTFDLTLNNLLFSDYRDKAVINGNYELRGGILNIDFDINGEASRGEGFIKIDLSDKTKSSQATGEAYVHYKGIGKKFNITGNLDNIKFEPE